MLVTDMLRHELLIFSLKLASLMPTPVQGFPFLLLLDAALHPEYVSPRPYHRELVDLVDVSVPVAYCTKPLVTILTGVSSFVNLLMML